MKSRIYIFFPYLNCTKKFEIEGIEFKGLFDGGAKIVINLNTEDERDQYHIKNILGSFRISGDYRLHGFTYAIQEVDTQEEYEDLKKRVQIATNIIRYKMFDKDERGRSHFPQTSLYIFELTEAEWKSKVKKLRSGAEFFWYKGLQDFAQEFNIHWPKELVYPSKHQMSLGYLQFPSTFVLLPTLDKFYWKSLNCKEEERLKIIRAIELYNKSHIEGAGVDDRDRILSLSAGFETLLNLPDEGIQQAFRATVITLLGDVPNLGKWALGFYNLRSKIVHGEEIVTSPRTKPTRRESKVPSLFFKHPEGEYEYIKHLEIGQNVFRKCLQIILHQRGNVYVHDIVSLLEPNEFHIKRIAEGLIAIKDKASVKEWYEKGVLSHYSELKVNDNTAKENDIALAGTNLLILLKRYLQDKKAPMDKSIDDIFQFKGTYIDLAMAYNTLQNDFEKVYFGDTPRKDAAEEYAFENAVYNFISFASHILFTFKGEI